MHPPEPLPPLADDLDRVVNELRHHGFARVAGAIPPSLRRVLSESIEPLARTGTLRAHFFEDGSISSAHGLSRSIPAFADFVRTTPMRRVAERLFESSLLPDPVEASYFPKAPHTGPASPLHQDNGFLRLSPSEGMACWFPLDDVDLASAPLVYLRGSHLEGLRPHALLGPGMQGLDAEARRQVDPARLETVPCKAGDCILHLAETVHGSLPNTSARARRGVNFVLVTGRAWASRAAPTDRATK